MARRNSREYCVLAPLCPAGENWFEFSAEMRSKMALPLRSPHRAVGPRKDISAHQVGSGCDSILAVHEEAIVVGAPAGTSDVFAMVVVFFVLFFVAAAGMAYLSVDAFLAYSNAEVGFNLPISIISFLFSLFLLNFSIFCFRLAFLTPRDQPVVFNRKTREVHFFEIVPMQFWRFWSLAGVGAMKTRRWEDVYARSYHVNELTGEVMRSSYSLALLWASEPASRVCNEIVNIGYKGWWEDELLWRLYEHIRRYMEEGGMPLPEGEFLRTSGYGKMPVFPQDVTSAAGGEALSEADIRQRFGSSGALRKQPSETTPQSPGTAGQGLEL